MVKLLRVSALAAFTGVLLVVGAPSCAHGPEVFCESWADQTCQAAAVCCQTTTRFDLEACTLSLSGSCQDSLDLAKIHAGEVVFDSGAASDCFGTTSCAGLQQSDDQSFDHVAACANVTTGFRRAGTGCNTPADCARGGAFSTCFRGVTGGGMGVCANVVLASDKKCGFTFDTNELRTCPDGTFCDTSRFKPDPNTPPSAVSHEFIAPCRNNPGAGAQCFDPDTQAIKQCAAGLFCDVNASPATCKKLKAKGKSCNSNEECVAGLGCVFDPGSSMSVCADPQISFCFTPAQCGDQICEGSEDSSNCPTDCGNSKCLPPGSSCDPSMFPSPCCPGLGCNPQIFACE